MAYSLGRALYVQLKSSEMHPGTWPSHRPGGNDQQGGSCWYFCICIQSLLGQMGGKIHEALGREEGEKKKKPSACWRQLRSFPCVHVVSTRGMARLLLFCQPGHAYRSQLITQPLFSLYKLSLCYQPTNRISCPSLGLTICWSLQARESMQHPGQRTCLGHSGDFLWARGRTSGKSIKHAWVEYNSVERGVPPTPNSHNARARVPSNCILKGPWSVWEGIDPSHLSPVKFSDFFPLPLCTWFSCLAISHPSLISLSVFLSPIQVPRNFYMHMGKKYAPNACQHILSSALWLRLALYISLSLYFSYFCTRAFYKLASQSCIQST